MFSNQPNSAFEPTTSSSPNSSGIVISRRQLLGIGAILFGTAIGAFALGWLFGSATRSGEQLASRKGPIRVMGQISAASSDSIVIFFPVAIRPETKLTFPNESISNTKSNHTLNVQLQSFGAQIVSVDELGNFSAVLDSSGEHFVLVLSNPSTDGVHTEAQVPETRVLAQIGRYVLHGDELLARHTWSWTEQTLSDNDQIRIDF